jgi:4-cresol dehydrogenase (hydroxylating)
VVLDLKRMNRILEVDDKNHYALVEPGVSYFDLYRYTQEKGLNVFIDAPDPGWGSPVGNTLDRGGGHTPLRDHFATLCGMEVVLANGDVVRTGMGAIPNSRTWQQYKYGFGPYVDGIFTQSNYGIVTKMGLWLYPMPETRITGIVSVPKHDDCCQPASRRFARSGIDRATGQARRRIDPGPRSLPATQEPTVLEH